MSKRGRLEGLVTVPEGGWSVSVVGTSSGTATIPEGDYYPSGTGGLLDTLEDELSSVTGDTVTVELSGGEDGDGKVTITSTATIAITWTDTEPRDILGFTGNLSGASTYESSNHARMVWLPDAPKVTPFGDGIPGIYKTNARASQNGATVKVLYGKRWREFDGDDLRWIGVSARRTLIAHEQTDNESVERFWIDAILGEFGGNPGHLRLFWDADDDDDYQDYVATDMQEFRPEAMAEGFAGWWIVSLGRLVAQ